MRRRPLLVALVSGGVAAVFAFLLVGRLSGAPDTDPDATSEPVVVVVATPILEGEDPWEVAVARAAADRARRDLASEAGDVVEDSATHVEPGAGSPLAEFLESALAEPDGAVDGPPEPGTLPLGELAPSAGDAIPAGDRAIDGCAGDAPPADCPEGIGATVLAHRSLPERVAVAKLDPYAPGTAPFSFWPECSPVEDLPGRVHIGVSTNRPSAVTVRYRPYSPYRPPPVTEDPHGATIGTSREAAEVWQAWFDDEGAGDDDPRMWIDHCFVFDGLEPGTYAFDAVARDPVDVFGDAFITRPPIFVSIADEHGEVPRQRRRPTALVPAGVDMLFVGATRQGDQTLVVRAHEAGTVEGCETGGAPESVLRPAAGVIDARPISDSAIPRATLDAPDYPYLPTHDRNVIVLLDLAEGSDYLLCLYWVAGEGRSIAIAEQHTVSTPDAYRPRIRFHGFEGLIVPNDPISVRVDMPGCAGLELRPNVSGSPSEPVGFGIHPPRRLCSPDRGLSVVDERQGFYVTSSLTFDGERYERRVFVRTGRLLCGVSPCLLRLDEVVLVPLPEVVTERRLCGSGWGSSCSSENPRRTAGFAALSVVYDRTHGNGMPDWVIGAAEAVFDPLPDSPRITVDAATDAGGYLPVDGMQATITVEADRPVSLTAELVPGSLFTCYVDEAPGGYSSEERHVVHRFTLRGLCLGERYAVAFSGADEAGNEVVVFHGGVAVPANTMRLWIPQALAVFSNQVTVPLPGAGDFSTYTVEATFYGGALRRVCTAREQERVVLDAPTWAIVDLGPIMVTGEVTIRRNLPVGGTVLRDCVPGEVVATHRFQARVNLSDLAAGLEIRSIEDLWDLVEDGPIYRVRLTSAVPNGFGGIGR